MSRGLIALIKVEFRDKIWCCKIFFVSSHLEINFAEKSLRHSSILKAATKKKTNTKAIKAHTNRRGH